MPAIWNVGLLNAKTGKYLTGEKFGFKVVATGASLKANQMWTLHLEGNTVSVQSPHRRFLSATEKGVISAEQEEISANEKFELIQEENGQFAFKSGHGYFFGGADDQLSCFSKKKEGDHLWIVQLAMHPHICLKNEMRKTYARLGDDELRLKAEVPFGAESAVLLVFDKETGKYCIQASNAKFLANDGTLVDSRTPATQFIMEFHNAVVAFRDADKKYLTGVGPNATMKTRRNKVDKDERFTLEDSSAQVSIVACSNGKRVSCGIRGQEMSAGVMAEDDLSADEIFQFEIQPESNKVALRTSKKNYVSAAGATLLASADKADDSCCFDVEWHNGYITMKTASGGFVSTKPNGTLASNADVNAESEETHYIVTIVNRPVIVFRGPFGFVARKSAASTVLEANRSSYEAFTVEAANGKYNLLADGKTWVMEGGKNTFSANGDAKMAFEIELVRPHKLLLKAPNGKYLKGESNGLFTATGAGVDKNTLWEF